MAPLHFRYEPADEQPSRMEPGRPQRTCHLASYQQQAAVDFASFPPEVLSNIYERLPTSQLCAIVNLVCKAWHTAAGMTYENQLLHIGRIRDRNQPSLGRWLHRHSANIRALQFDFCCILDEAWWKEYLPPGSLPRLQTLPLQTGHHNSAWICSHHIPPQHVSVPTLHGSGAGYFLQRCEQHPNTAHTAGAVWL